MEEKTRITSEAPRADVAETDAQERAAEGFAEEAADGGFAGIASFADAESREILNLLGDDAAGGSCCGGSCCST